MNPANEELKRLVQEGAVKYIFRAEQALSILEITGKVAKEINAHNYGEVFGTFQAFCIDQFVLSVSKLYEEPRRYALRSIPAILNFFSSQLQELKITEPHLLNQQLSRLGLYTSDFDVLNEADKNSYIHQKLSESSPKIDNNLALGALKTLRDKSIAHPEDVEVESLDKTTWDEAEKLLRHPKDVVGVIGDGYLSTAYMLENGEYLLTSDATRVSRGTERLLKEIGVLTT